MDLKSLNRLPPDRFELSREFKEVYFIDGSPSDFYIILESSKPILKALEKSINKRDLRRAVSYRNKIIYGVRWNSHHLHRAILLGSEGLSSDTKMVRFIDYGTSEIVKTSDIFELHDDLIQVPPLAIRCTLHNIQVRSSFQWKAKEIISFRNFLSYERLILEVAYSKILKTSEGPKYSVHFNMKLNIKQIIEECIPVQEDLNYYETEGLSPPPQKNILESNNKVSNWVQKMSTECYDFLPDKTPVPSELRNKTKNLKDSCSSVSYFSKNSSSNLSSMSETPVTCESSESDITYLPNRQTITPGTKIEFIISHIESVEEFYINVKDENLISFPSLLQKMNEFYEGFSLENLNESVAQGLIAFKSKEGWFRGHYNKSTKLVFAIDLGYTLKMENCLLSRKLNSKFVNIPPLAVRCFLPNLSGPKYCDYFKSLKPCGFVSGTVSKQRIFEANRVSYEIMMDVKRGDRSVPIHKALKMLSGSNKWDCMRKEYLDSNNTLNYSPNRVESINNTDYVLSKQGVKHELCKFVSSGYQCPRIDTCSYLHSTHDAVNMGKDFVFFSSFNFFNLPAKESLISLQITTVFTPKNFYSIHCPRADDEETLKSMGEELNKFYKQKKLRDNFNPLSPGEIVAAIFPDDHYWYRAKILEYNDDVCKVFFVDFGNISSVCTITEIRPIDPRFLHLPFQAISSSLVGIKPKRPYESWSKRACIFFYKLTKDTILFSKVIGSSADESLYLELYKKENNKFVSIKDLLINHGLATEVSENLI